MRRAAFAIAILLPLFGCDDPGAGKALAQCELDRRARVPNYFEHYASDFLETCMKSKGYVEDRYLKERSGSSCRYDPWWDEDAVCYRPDNGLAELLARF
jgi:hypothetical protein